MLIALSKKIQSILLTQTKLARDAYDLWANEYDNEIIKGNLTILYNDFLVSHLLKKDIINNKVVYDIGAGTGSHFKRIMSFEPHSYLGCDISSEMLKRFNIKYPEAETILLKSNKFPFAKTRSVDTIFSSLMLGYAENIDEVFKEWDRILKPNGIILVTFLHPYFAKFKNARSFKLHKNTVIIKSYFHDIETIETIFNKLNWEILNFHKEVIDERCTEMLKTMNKRDSFNILAGKELVCGYIIKKKK